MLVFVERRLLNFACYVGIPEQVLLFGKARQKGSKKKRSKIKNNKRNREIAKLCSNRQWPDLTYM